MKKFILLIFIIVASVTEAYSCECIHSAVSFAKRIKSADLIILGEINEILDHGIIKVKVIELYSGKNETGIIYLLNGGTLCSRSFFDNVGTQYIFAFDQSEIVHNGQTLFEVPSCIESALLYDKEINRVKGNITRMNSFVSRLAYSLRIYKLPINHMTLNRIEKKIIRNKINTNGLKPYQAC